MFKHSFGVSPLSRTTTAPRHHLMLTAPFNNPLLAVGTLADMSKGSLPSLWTTLRPTGRKGLRVWGGVFIACSLAMILLIGLAILSGADRYYFQYALPPGVIGIAMFVVGSRPNALTTPASTTPGFNAASPRASTGTVILTDCASEIEATAIVSALRSEGIHAEVRNGAIAQLRADIPVYAQVMILAHDAERATQVLNDTRAQAAKLDWSTVDVGTEIEGDAPITTTPDEQPPSEPR